MDAAILYALIAISFCGVRADDDEAATLVLMEPCPKALQALQPKFLTEASEEARQQFGAIIADKSLTIAEIEDKLNKWAAEQGEQIQSEFEDARKKLQSMFAKEKEAIEQSSLSGAAKEAFTKISEIIGDKEQTAEQRAQRMKQFMDSLSEDVHNEIKEFLKSQIATTFEKIKSEFH